MCISARTHFVLMPVGPRVDRKDQGGLGERPGPVVPRQSRDTVRVG